VVISHTSPTRLDKGSQLRFGNHQFTVYIATDESVIYAAWLTLDSNVGHRGRSGSPV
jgi:hypothetical protein